MTDLRIDTGGARVLLVDADGGRRAALAATLGTLGCEAVLEAAGAADCRPAADGRAPDLVIIDVDEGITASTLTLIRTTLGPRSDVPVLGLTSDPTPESRARVAAAGVHDVAVAPIDPVELRLRLQNALTGARLRQLLSDRSARLTESLRDQTTDIDTVRESLAALAAMADFHDDDSDHHAQRVGCIAAAIARTLGLSEASVAMMRAAAPLHDIGKVGISRRILLKPGKLTPPEWMHMMQHVDIGGQILASAQSPVLRLAGEIARTHHERWDGSGYTAGLAGEEIPLSGRMVAVADVWDTLTHNRPYRKAWEPERALTEIRDQAGAHFDPRVVEAFCGLDLEALASGDDEPRLVA
jgi:putative two-component system response regulator